MASRPSQEKLIRCAHCGEDYSPTYRKCPFCGMRNDPRTAQVQGTDRPSRPVDSEADPELTRVVPRVEDIEDDPEAGGLSSPRRDRPQEEEDDGYVFDGQDLFDDEDDYEDDYRPARGGKRLAGGSGSGRGGRGPRPASGKAAPAAINWPRVITFLCSLIIIIAAMVILFTIIYPQLHKNPNPQTSAPGGSETLEPSGQVEPSEQVQPSQPAEPSADVSGQPGALMDLSVETGQVDLPVGGTYQFVPLFEPADWSGQVTFTSSDPQAATVDENGVVTNVNTEAGTVKTATITISADGLELPCTVNCAGPAAVEPTATPTAPPAGGEIAPGTRGVIAGASGGLRVRSGPGTTYSQVTSLKNGDAVTVVSYAGDGWYEITYAGSGGQPSPGYILGEYISVG